MSDTSEDRRIPEISDCCPIFENLKESAEITKNDALSESAEDIRRAGEMFTEIALLFKESEKTKDLDQRIRKASGIFHAVAKLEENVYLELAKSIK